MRDVVIESCRFDFQIKASYLQTVTGEGDLALQAMVRDPGEEERGEGDNTASSAYAEQGLRLMMRVVVMVMMKTSEAEMGATPPRWRMLQVILLMIEIHMVSMMMTLDDEYCDNTMTSHPPT